MLLVGSTCPTIHASADLLSYLLSPWNRSDDCQHVIASGEGCDLMTDIAVCAYLKAAVQGSDSYLVAGPAT